MMLNQEISKRRDAAISNGVGMMTQIYVDRALNSEVWDVESYAQKLVTAVIRRRFEVA